MYREIDHVVRHRTERDDDNDASDAREYTAVDRPIRDLVEELCTGEQVSIVCT